MQFAIDDTQQNRIIAVVPGAAELGPMHGDIATCRGARRPAEAKWRYVTACLLAVEF